MRLWTHAYQITPPGSLAQRRGLLVKLENTDQSLGYADLMSWPELGEKEISEELYLILNGNPTPLGQRVLALAEEDGRARKNRHSFWDASLQVPPSHYFVGSLDDLYSYNSDFHEKKLGFSSELILKAKVSVPMDSKILFDIKNPLRLDFNEKGELDVLLKLFSDKALRQKIDFLEDPFPASELRNWQIFKERYPDISLFGDHALDKNPELLSICDGVILKPASRNEMDLLKSARLAHKKICVTHSMGHPLGQSVAANFAALHSVNSTGLWPSPTLHGLEFNWAKKSAGFGYGWESAIFDRLSWIEESFIS